MIAVDYECPHHGRFELLEPIEPQDSRPCEVCGHDSVYCFPAPSVKPNYGSVTQGQGSTERPKDFVSTSAIADGMSMHEWRKAHGERRKERIRQHVKAKL